MAQNLESNDVGIIILGEFESIREGDKENVLENHGSSCWGCLDWTSSESVRDNQSMA